MEEAVETAAARADLNVAPVADPAAVVVTADPVAEDNSVSMTVGWQIILSVSGNTI